MTNKYAALKRSQILMAIHHAETKLLLWKSGDSRRPAVAKDREAMFAALQEKDREITAAWESAHLFQTSKRKI